MNRPVDLGIRRRLPTSTPILVGLGTAVLASLSWMQWLRPTIEHDDWMFLLHDGPRLRITHLGWVLTSGRWLNYWSWLSGEPNLSARYVVLIFAAGWLLLTGVFVRAITTSWWAVPLAVAVYGAPMTADISYWPATLSPSMTSLGIGAALLWPTRDRWGWHLAILAIAVGVTTLGYPMFAMMLLVLMVAMHHRAGWRRLAIGGGTFVGAYIGTLLLVFVLNDLRFGHFGIKIATWRHPTPLNSVDAALRHLGVAGYDWRLVLQATLIPLILAVIALIAALSDRALRRQLGVLAVGFAITLGLATAPALLQGVNDPFRSTTWFWLYLVLVVAWTAQSAVRRVRTVGRIALVAIAIWGALYWADGVVGHHRFEVAMDRVENEAVAMAARTGGRITVAPRGITFTDTEINTAEQLKGALAKEHGLTLKSRCSRGCPDLLGFADRHQITGDVFYVHGWVVVRLPESVLRHELDVLPKPWWLQPVPWESTVQQ